MVMYVSLVQFTDQGVRNVNDTIKRSEAAMTEAEKMGMKIVQPLWTMGAYDVVVLLAAPDDETMSAFTLKIFSMGSVKTHTMRAFTKGEMGKHSGKDQIGAINRRLTTQTFAADTLKAFASRPLPLHLSVSCLAGAFFRSYPKNALTRRANALRNLDYVIRRLDALSTA